MIVAGIRSQAEMVYCTQISGDRQELKAKLARVQDNAEELLALIKQNVTEEQAMRYDFITNVVKALEMRGYGGKIKFKQTSLPALPREDTKQKTDLGSLPFYEILERRGLVAYAAQA